jgi:hypothetical protein
MVSYKGFYMGFAHSEPNPSLKSNQIQTQPNQTHKPNQTWVEVAEAAALFWVVLCCADEAALSWLQTRQDSLGFRPDKILLALDFLENTGRE